MSEDYADLAKRLRLFADGDVREIGRDLILGIIPLDRKDFETWATLMEKASDALTALIAERDALRKALKPFAVYAECAYRTLGDGATALKTTINGGATVTVGDFWHARDLLKQDNT